jgi:hypothetical protein
MPIRFNLTNGLPESQITNDSTPALIDADASREESLIQSPTRMDTASTTPPQPPIDSKEIAAYSKEIATYIHSTLD